MKQKIPFVINPSLSRLITFSWIVRNVVGGLLLHRALDRIGGPRAEGRENDMGRYESGSRLQEGSDYKRKVWDVGERSSHHVATIRQLDLILSLSAIIRFSAWLFHFHLIVLWHNLHSSTASDGSCELSRVARMEEKLHTWNWLKNLE